MSRFTTHRPCRTHSLPLSPTPLFLSLLLLLALRVSPARAQFSSGLFTRATGDATTCAATLTLRAAPPPAASALALDGAECAAGANNLTFIDATADPRVPQGTLQQAGIAAIYVVRLTAPLTCGASSSPAGTGYVYLRLTSSVPTLVRNLILGALRANAEFAPFVPAFEAAELTPGVTVASTRGCVWRLSGPAPSPSPAPGSEEEAGDEQAAPSGEALAPPVGSPSNRPQADHVDISACFPAHATVQLRGGRAVPMRDLRVGHHVRVADGQFSPVILWTHRDASVRHDFVRVALSDGKTLTVSRGHFVYALPSPTSSGPSASSAPAQLVAAEQLRAGMRLQDAHRRLVRIDSVDSVRAVGLYNPQTAHGDIVVDGVRCSTYTTAVPAAAGHALLAPVRAAFCAVRRLLPGVTAGLAGGVQKQVM